MELVYPTETERRTEWIVAHRAPHAEPDPERPYAFLVEEELSASGEIFPVATIFLTNRECPWRCVMCDLWKNTRTEPVARGAIPRQIEFALERLPAAQQIKLYNSGSFFDLQAIPREDYGEIARLAAGFDRTIVECHPALVGDRCVAFQDLLAHPLEIAMGLETAHPEVLEQLNKRMTLEQFAQAAEFLRTHRIDVRVFILVQPPFLPADEALHWARRSLDFAFDCGATAVSLIPTRGGNGAMEALAREGQFRPPSLATLEQAVAYGVGLKRGRVFADLWDLQRVKPACACSAARLERLHAINLGQALLEPIACPSCEGNS